MKQQLFGISINPITDPTMINAACFETIEIGDSSMILNMDGDSYLFGLMNPITGAITE